MGKNLRLSFADPSISPASPYKIKVLGVGGAGGNIVDTMVKEGVNGIEFVAINTDSQALTISQSPIKIQIGGNFTKGLGSGGDPDTGRKAMEENYDDVKELIKNTDVLFITCGMGGGTGTGASPIIAKMAKEMGKFTIAVATFPFSFEGSVRANQAREGIFRLKRYADAIIVAHNQKLFTIVNEKVGLMEAFEVVNQIVYQIVYGITEIINTPGLVNVDFADVRTVMSEQGETFIGIGKGSGEGRAKKAAHMAINSALLGEKSIRKSLGVLVNITGDSSFTLYEANEVMKIVQENVRENANIIFGAYINKERKDEIGVTLVATGIRHNSIGIPHSTNNRSADNWVTREENLKIPTFKRKKKLYLEDINFKENENLDIPAFMRRKDEINS
ncbi:MAG: cell division protein FtsZ [Candidatus Stahlbacteria bacterium]|nr:cell division protein FtsZ [Candidatus Stahlbacteria bacterium]